MSKMSDLQNTQDSQRKPQQRGIRFFDGMQLAKVFAYYLHAKKPNVDASKIPLLGMSGRHLYDPHKKAFDDFAALAKKNEFDVEPYVKFCVDNGISEKNVESCLTFSNLLSKFNEHVKDAVRLKKIYKWFIKSAMNIAEETVDLGYFSSRDFIRMLILKKQIGAYIVSGRISLYWFAAIPKFNTVIPKLDYFSKLELQPIEKWYDIYHSDVNRAFLQEKKTMVNPIDFTDLLIHKISEKQKRHH